jgi:hypothetical protein
VIAWGLLKLPMAAYRANDCDFGAAVYVNRMIVPVPASMLLVGSFDKY